MAGQIMQPLRSLALVSYFRVPEFMPSYELLSRASCFAVNVNPAAKQQEGAAAIADIDTDSGLRLLFPVCAKLS